MLRYFQNGLLVTLCLTAWPGMARTVSLLLNNGDRITGQILASHRGALLLSNQWAGSLEIRLNQIRQRDDEVEAAPGPPIAPVVTNAVTVNIPTNKVARLWKLEAQLGLDVAYGIRERQIYYGRLRTERKSPYPGDPKQSYRLLLDYNAEYGRTDAQLSANKMEGGADLEFDLNRRLFVYNDGRVGYNIIRKIDLHYEVGPGLGVHIVHTPKLTLDARLGVNYQAEIQTDGNKEEAFYLRLEQDSKWFITDKLTFEQKIEYFPAVDTFSDYRVRAEAGLRYKLLQNLSLNLSMQDLYDTQPARDIAENELKVRSSLGLNF